MKNLKKNNKSKLIKIMILSRKNLLRIFSPLLHVSQSLGNLKIIIFISLWQILNIKFSFINLSIIKLNFIPNFQSRKNILTLLSPVLYQLNQEIYFYVSTIMIKCIWLINKIMIHKIKSQLNLYGAMVKCIQEKFMPSALLWYKTLCAL